MQSILHGFAGLAALALATAAAAPALAQDSAITVGPATITGGATLTSDYRFRGLTQSNEDPAAQATLNVNFNNGFYVGTWASTIAGSDPGDILYASPDSNYGAAEVDLYAGYSRQFGGITADAGLLYYYYPDGNGNTDYFEPYASLSYTLGPVQTKVGANYAWGGQKGLDYTDTNDDNIYVYGEAGVGIPTTPITLKGHVGYTKGSLGEVKPGSLPVVGGVTRPGDDGYLDWSLTAQATGGPLNVGVTYVDTDVPTTNGFAKATGRESTVLAFIGVTF